MDPATARMAAHLAANLARSRAARTLVVGVVVLSVAASLGVAFGPLLFATQLASTWRAQLSAGNGGCAGDPIRGPGSATGLTKEQVGNARVIWQVGIGMGVGDRGAVVGIATALQESGLRNLSYGDRDSVGLFQQRAGWGSVAVRMNPQASAGLFYAALKKVAGWQDMALTRAAQAVQRSAFPDAYAKHEARATGLVALFRHSGGAGGAAAGFGQGELCGGGQAASCPASGLGVEAGLTPDALRVLRCARQRWPQLTSIGGVGDRPGNVDRDHQEGRAVDLMIPDYRSPAGRRLGAEIAAWAVASRQSLGVKYVIWDSRIWSVQRAAEGWRSCGTGRASCYAGSDDTAAHRDHVHVSVFGDQGGGAGRPGVSGPVVRPVDHYVLTARFGECSSRWLHCHTGLDFATGTGAPIRAIMAGRVVWSGWGGRYGNLTKLQHAGGVQSWYAHQSSRGVKVGDVVLAGQVIGRVGQTGNANGPHLHLEVRNGGVPVDPARWLSARGVAP